MADFKVNGKKVQSKEDPEKPLLYFLRDDLGLMGTKYGCGIGECGACTVVIDGSAEQSCQVLVQDLDGKSVTTIEGLSENHVIKQAWLQEQVPQCGYCQPGQIMQASALLNEVEKPDEQDIAQAMDHVLCRCGTYPRIKKAIYKAYELTLQKRGQS